jgi:7,8-dihydropterin-6-yl-methyl-4-(beta-D-ribofuranosyl)aminobenzene 5'-phosphate synthase
VPVTNRAVQISRKKIHLITGGFHLSCANTREIKRIINALKVLGVENIAPSHCTGERAISSFQDAWKHNFIEAGCGVIIEVSISNSKTYKAVGSN